MTDEQASADPVADASTVAPPSSAPEDLTELRLRLHRNGYRPIPVLGAHVAMKGAGKRPMMKGWETVCASIPRSPPPPAWISFSHSAAPRSPPTMAVIWPEARYGS